MRVSVVAVAMSLFGAAIAAPANAAVTAAPTRTVSYGTIVGQTSVATQDPSALTNRQTATVQQYFGIPFAAVPTGSLRFLPPAAPTKLKQPLKATSLPPACMQQFVGAQNGETGEQKQYNNPFGPAPAESEDCLYLNVYTPANSVPGSKKAVMFWIFGGEMQFGTGGYRWYNGSFFAGFQDIIVVTPNFRNNFFGFPGDGPKEIPVGKQNVGMLDIQYALTWVQNNIAAFGGDPTKVTIMGESSGGWAVKQLMAFPPSPMTFRAAIMESQETNVSASTANEYGRILDYFKCDNLDCLRKVPAETLRLYQDEHTDFFNPVTDNITLAASVAPRVTNKQMANIPWISGTNADEGRAFIATAGLGNQNANTSSYLQFLDEFFPYFSGMNQIFASFLTAFGNGPYEAVGRLVTDGAFDCPLSTFDNTALANGYSNQWRYYYTAVFQNEQDFADAGAYHSSEIPQVWGTYDFPSAFGQYTAEQVTLSHTMQTAWANFIKNLDPGMNWPKLGSFANFGATVAKFQNSGLTFTSQEEPDIYCPMWAPLIAEDGY